MLLQGNLPLEFKESGTLLGRFWEEFENLRIVFWGEKLEKEEKRGVIHVDEDPID